jgi:hypothetical protein
LQGDVWSPTSWHPANKLLKKRLAKKGYFKQPHTPSLWKHESRPVWFSLAVDDFGITYIGNKHLQHLYNALRQETYDIVEDQTGNLYCGINLKWNYDKGYVDLAMPQYVMKQLTRYAHPAPNKPQHYPYSPNPITYEKTIKHPHLPMRVSSLTTLVKNASNRSLVASFTMHVLLTPPY